jgi:sugar transferase EpsL
MDNNRDRQKIQTGIKRAGDWVFSGLILLLLLPVMLIVAITIRLVLGNPIIFTQPRPGLGGKIFQFYKFRTMTSACDESGNLLPDAQRLSPFGLFLRKTSLDELPQLINIFKGEMSFVGPRPLLVRYLNRYSPEQFRRHEVKPGITGLAQVNGRNALSWEQKFSLDVEYIDQWTLGLDLKILLLTVWKVVQQDGINQEGYTTSQEFMGSDHSQQDP